MQEIKFRAYDPIRHLWIYSDTYVLFYKYWLDTAGLEQQQQEYTGLKDIYDGDITTMRNRPNLHCLVYFDEGDFSWRLAVNGDKQHDKTYPLMFADKVIGNIYENPELIKEA